MPFTPFHLSLGIGLGLPLRRYFHTPTFLLANIILDLEPFLVLFFRLDYPLHGYVHTFLLGMPVGLALGYIAFLLERFLHSLYKALLLEASNGSKMRLKHFFVAGTLGTVLHLLLDAPLYSDIKPFYPAAVNPLYNPSLAPEIYGLCALTGFLGMIYYFRLLFSHLAKSVIKIER